ncbi:PqqD family peptide modification chaperone [Ramlibacter sp. G-1-2-2]|uniref:PqqD family peptide modification chaperone n=1 Tax=Ramlibacter agri TaxID=2728837 RepID=A0A848H7H1_9BURK|nr:PqqD family peptide modification chaperone [Ramlibacter agri]NML45872.1 PqqD family peptide modification chaperone [Ramlibacter agri]
MSAALLSGHWFRVAALKPALRPQVRIQRHVYRGQVWYLLHDLASGENFRLNPAGYAFVRELDGKRSLQQLWDALVARRQENTPTQAEIVQVLGQLNAADLVQVDGTPDVAELLQRGGRRKRRQRLSRWLNPMSIKLPLWDPDAALAAAAAWVPRLPPALWLLASLLGGAVAIVLAAENWSELTRDFGQRLLATSNLWLLALVFPLLKAVHELAHGFAVKRGGGEVHDMGLMFLVFYPVPYVDASAAHAFPGKWQRAWVCAAGMVAELWLAMLALFAWLALEPGPLRAVAYNIAVLGSVTTLVFNANPLLRYDGYYMLADLLEIPNLGARSTRYWQYLATRYVFGVRDAKPFPATRGEKRWFLVYASLALVYRLAVTLAISWFIGQHYFGLGVLLAGWSVLAGVLLPVARALAALFTDPRFVARASRVWLVLSGTLGAAVLLLFVLPLPHHTRVEGVLWLPEQATVRAGADGFVERLQPPGSAVQSGDVVMVMANPLLAARIAQQQGRVDEVAAKLDAVWGTQPAQATQLGETLAQERAQLQRLQDEAAQLRARSRAAGSLLIERADDQPGRFVHKGDIVAHVLGEYRPVVRLVVQQADVAFVQADVRSVEVRLPQQPGAPMQATLVRSVPKAAPELPSAALGQGGGGRLLVDPRDERQVKAMESLFEFEAALPPERHLPHLGSRAYVSVEHSPEAVGWRWWRAGRRALLSQLGV